MRGRVSAISVDTVAATFSMAGGSGTAFSLVVTAR